MRRHIPGLNTGHHGVSSNLDGLFLVRVERASYRWHPQKPFLALQFRILEPTAFEALLFSGRLYCTERALWKLTWFLRDFGYDPELLTRDQVDEKALLNLQGSRPDFLYQPEWAFLPEPRFIRCSLGVGGPFLRIKQAGRGEGGSQ